MSRGNNKEAAVKIVYIDTQYVETDATSFKSVVQTLTGKDSLVAGPDPGGPGSSVLHNKAAKTEKTTTKMSSRGVSFKEFDRLLLRELPPFEELYRLCAD